MQAKITHMAQNPPSESVMTQVAWPLDPVFEENGAFAGFVMPRLRITAELGKVYEYPSQTNITFRQKLILAENICVVIHAVHEAGYIFGDFNPRNIGVDLNTGMVAFLDTDSYHIVLDRAKNLAYRCNVCAPGYCAPELLKKCAEHITAHPEDQDQAYAKTPLDTFTRETDHFALAIHIFRLLMNGFSPYGGIRETESASVGAPGVGDQAVKRDSYCFKKGIDIEQARRFPL
jgi:DNA-binding helix-hairpin-helix protein with protein kinase domain